MPKAIVCSGNNVTLLTSSTHTVSNSNQFIGLTSFGKSGTFTYDRDIGVISVIVDSSNVTTTNNPPGYTQYTGAYRLKVVIKNFGNIPVQQFYLNHYLRTELCGKTYYHPWITSLLAPGATVSITTPMFSDIVGVYPGAPSSHTFVINNSCVYTSLPDNKNDKDYTNDASCITVSIPFVTSIEQRSLASPHVKISPNPFHDKIIISSESEIRKVEVLDIMGQLISSFTPNDSTVEVTLDGTKPGIYFLKIFSENGTITKKAVKE